MQTKGDFSTDIRAVRNELENRLDSIRRKRRFLGNEAEDIRARKLDVIEAIADRHLPDLMPETVANLRRLDHAFFTKEVEGEIGRASAMHSSYWRYSLPLIGPWLYMRDSQAEYDSVRDLLLARIEALDPKPHWCSDVGTLDAEIKGYSDELAKLSIEASNLRLQLASLNRLSGVARANFDQLDPAVVSSVRSSAQGLRSRADDRRRRSDSDSGLDPIDLVLLHILLNSGSSPSSPNTTVVGGGGEFLGGGAQDGADPTHDAPQDPADHASVTDAEPARAAFTTGGLVGIAEGSREGFTTGGMLEDEKPLAALTPQGNGGRETRDEEIRHDDTSDRQSSGPSSKDEGSGSAPNDDSRSGGGDDSRSHESPSAPDTSGGDSSSASSDSGSSSSSSD